MNRKRLLAFCATLAVVALPFRMIAADRTWTGSGADTLWSTADNWGGTAPVANDALRFDGASGLSNTNNLTADTSFAGVTFLSGASPFSLSGNRITLGGNVVNQSPLPQTVGLPLLLNTTADRYFDTANGSVIFSGSLNYDVGTTARYYKKTGTNELVITGTTLVTNLYSRFALDEGTLRFASGSRFHLVDTSSNRDIFRIGNVVNKKSAVIVEAGADVALGGTSLQMTGLSGGTSTFDLTVKGSLLFTGSDNTFGDQTGNRMTCVVDGGGSLATVSNAAFCAGTRIPMTMTLNDGSVWLGNLYTGRSGTGDRPGSFTLFINKGTFFVQNDFGWMNSTATVRTNIVTLGNGTKGQATLSTLYMSQASTTGTTIFNLNGGKLECRSGSSNYFAGLDQVNLLVGGITIDTQGNSVSVTESILRDPTLSLDTRDGGLTKLGTGSLTFSSLTNQFNGPLRVENGSLRISSAMLSDLEEIYLAPGKTLSFRGSYRQALVPERLTLGNATTASRLDFDANSDGSDCDSIHIPVGGYVGKLNIYLKQRGATDVDLGVAGDYPIFTYESEPPDVSLLTHANRTFGSASSFVVDRAAKTVILRLVVSDAETAWTNSGSGDWETAANWTPASPAGTPESRAHLWGAITAPSTVTLSTDARIGSFSFNNTNSYTLAGTGLLSVGDQNGGGYIISDSGSHTIDLKLDLLSPITMNVPPSQTLTLNGVVSGDGGIVKGNSGTLLLSHANTFAGGIKVTAGTVSIPAVETLGAGPLTLAGGTASLTAGGSYTFSNALRVQTNGVLNIGSATVTYPGTLDWTSAGTLSKEGSGELTLSGSCDENSADVMFNFRQGTTRLVSGARYSLRGASRDVLQTTYSADGQTSTLIIETNALLSAGGMRLLAGGSVGTSTVAVVGGRLELLDAESTIVNVHGGRADISVSGGGSLYDAGASFFSLGTYALGTLTVADGDVSLGLLTVGGYGENVGGGSRQGQAQITVGNGGTLEVRDFLTWITDNVGLESWVRLDGGRLTIPATTRSTDSTGTARLILDGGTLVCSGVPSRSASFGPQPTLDDYLYGVDELLLGADGVTVDTRAYGVTVTQPLAMESGTSSAAGFVKTGAGTLTLSGANTFDAPVSVSAGTLVLPALPANALTVAAGARLDPSLDSVQTESLTAATFATGASLTLDIAASGASDCLAVSGALSLGDRLNIVLNGDTQTGVFTLFTYGSLSGSVSALRVANPDPDCTYAFADTGSAISLTVTANANVSRWANDADGDWGTDTNWDTQIVPDGAGYTARFDLDFTAVRTVTLDGTATLGALLFDSATAPVVAGTATLTFNNSSTLALLEVDQGAPVVNPPLALSVDTAVLVDPAASLMLAGNIGGAGTLAVQGGGTLILEGTNTAAQTTVSGGTLTLGETGSQEAPLTLDGATLAASVSSAVSIPVTSGPCGATVVPAAGTTLTLSGTLDGEGGVAKSGSGTLALTGTLAYQGATFADGGTLALVAPPPAALTLGAGTLAYSGTDTDLPGYTLNVGTGAVAAVLASDANLTVTGAVSAVAGGFVKTGNGTLAFIYPGKQTLGLANSTVTQDAILNIGADGDAPTQGFNPFSVSDGTMILGAVGQVNTFSGNLAVGMYTTDAAGSETAAHLIITGGTTAVTGNISVGRGNGNVITAPTPLESSVTINDGTVTVGAFSIGNNGGNATDFNAHPAVTVNGGDVTAGQINLAEHLGSVATFTINGGDVTVTDQIRVGHQTTSGGGGTGTLTVNGGTLTVPTDINLGVTASAIGTLHVAGGLTAARNIAVGNGTGTILFDGGILSLNTGPMVNVQASVMTGGAVLDVQSGRFTLGVPLLAGEAGDGGLTKTGAGMLAIDNLVDHTYTGPTLVNEGTLSLRGENASLPAATVLTVATGAVFHASSELVAAPHLVTVGGLALGSTEASAEDAVLGLWLNANNQCDVISVTGALTLGHVAVYAYQAGSLDSALYNGVYPIIAYTGADPDVSGMAVANPNAARNYAFSVDSGNKRVLLTVTDSGTVAADAVWIRDGDGDWSAISNWQNDSVPNGITTPVQFNGIISQPRTVNVDIAASVGGFTFNSTNRYTLGGTGTLTLSGDAPAITAQTGSHTIVAPLAVAGSASVALKPSGNTLTLAGGITGTGAALDLATVGTVQLSNTVVQTAVTVDNGTLELTGDASVAGTLRYNAGQILATGNASVDGALELPPGNKSVRANSGATLTLNGSVIGHGSLVKDNSGGTLRLAAANNYDGGTRVLTGTLAFSGSGTPGTGPVSLEGGTLASDGGAPVAFDNPIAFTNSTTVQADAPLITGGTMTMPGARTLTKQGSNIWSIGGALIGGGTNDSYRFYLRNGVVRFAAGSVFCMASTTAALRNQFDASVAEAGCAMGLMIESNADVTVGSFGVQFGSILPGAFDMVMNGGRFTLMGSDNPLGLGDSSNAVISVTVNGGEWTTVSDAAWCDLGTRCPVTWVQNGGFVSFGRPAFGRQNGAGSGRWYGGVDMTINGGTFQARDFFSWKSTDYAYVTNTLTLGCGTPQQGRFSVPATKRYSTAGRVIMNMDGGVLETRGLCSSDSSLNGSLSDYLYGVNDINVLAGGAVVDALTNSVTITQTLTADAAGDGGVTKLGTGTLVLSADVALTGAVTVAEGTLAAHVISTSSLAVSAGGVFDARGQAASFAEVSGSGQLSNGVVTVLNTLSPGDAGAAVGTLRAEDLSLVAGVKLRYDWSEETNDLVAVSGQLTASTGGFVDFGREEGNELTIPFSAVLGTYGTFGGAFTGWKSINTGLPDNVAVATTITAHDGVVTLNVTYSGLLLLLR